MEIFGFVLMAVGGLWLVGKAFSEGLLWGLGCLFIPLVTLYFAVTRFKNTKVPFGIWVAG